jgi:alanine dehydrogenase
VLSAGQIAAPPRSEVAVPEAGFLLTMPGYQPGQGIAVKLVTAFEGNAARGLPSHLAILALFDPATGQCLALLDGTPITAMRTAAASALATRLLARPDAAVLAIIGAGVQGAAHLQMVPLVRDFHAIRVFSPQPEHAARLAASDSRAQAVASAEEAVRGADVICLCTSSPTPVIAAAWLRSGTHVTSVGYHPPHGELDPALATQGRLFVETRLAFAPPPAGCGELAGIDPALGAELGEVIAGQRPGRQSADEITVYKSMGHVMEDLAAASLVYRHAVAHGLGRLVEL